MNADVRPSLACPKCGLVCDVETVLDNCRWSNTFALSLWYVCRECGAGSPIEISGSQMSVCGIVTLPGPEYGPITSVIAHGLHAERLVNGMKVSFRGRNWWMPI